MLKGVGSQFPLKVNALFSDAQFPCGKRELLEIAKRKNADAEMMENIQDLPDVEYQNMTQVIDEATQGS